MIGQPAGGNRVTSISAGWVITGVGEPIRNGIVTVEGDSIVGIDTHGSADQRFDDSVLVPGFINAHTHLDLSDSSSLRPSLGTSFTDWLRATIAHRQNSMGRPFRDTYARGLAVIQKSAATGLGDILGGTQTDVELADTELMRMTYREVLGLRPERFEAMWQIAESCARAFSDFGVSPHAPYSSSKEIYRRTQSLPASIPLCTHWFESKEERTLLSTGGGPMREFLESVGAVDILAPREAWSDDPWHEYLGNPSRWLLVHANYVTQADLERALELSLGEPLRIVYCPRTHSAFRHERYPLEMFLDAHCKVALGTDGLGSNPDLDIFEEAKHVAREFPNVTGAQILKALTIDGASAIGRNATTGTIEIGKRADLAVIQVRDPSASSWDVRKLFDRTAAPVWVMRGGCGRFLDRDRLFGE